MEHLLVDEIMLRSFCESVLKPLVDDEVYIVMLFARRKYYESLRRSTQKIDTLILRDNSPDYIYHKLKKFLYVDGCYYDRTAEQLIPPNSMVCYIDIDPKSVIKAFTKFTSEFIEKIYDMHINWIDHYKTIRKFESKFFSALSKSPSRKEYIIVDIDKKDKRLLKNTLNKIYNQFSKEEHNYVKWVTETRGGYHIILDNDKPLTRFLYETVKPSSKYIEIDNKNTMTPIPGTLQGGFLVKGINGSVLAL